MITEIPDEIQNKLHDPLLMQALVKDYNALDYMDMRILDATRDFIGVYMLLYLKGKLLQKGLA